MSGCTCKPVYTVMKPRKDPEWNEWVTVVKRNGKRDEGKTYYTDDRDDALKTNRLTMGWVVEENRRLCKCRK